MTKRWITPWRLAARTSEPDGATLILGANRVVVKHPHGAWTRFYTDHAEHDGVVVLLCAQDPPPFPVYVDPNIRPVRPADSVIVATGTLVRGPLS